MKAWLKQVMPAVRRLNPGEDPARLEAAVKRLALAFLKDRKALVHNDLEGVSSETSLLEYLDWRMGPAAPLCPSFGTSYIPQEQAPNPTADMLRWFLSARKEAKKKMLEHVNDADRSEHERWDRVQKVVKILNNSYYGASGERSSYFFNPRSGPSVTYTGRTVITASVSLFEGLLGGARYFLDASEAVAYAERASDGAGGRESGRLLSREVAPEELAEDLASRIFTGGKIARKPGDKLFLLRACEAMTPGERQRAWFADRLLEFLKEPEALQAWSSCVDSGGCPDPDRPPESALPSLEALWELVDEFCVHRFPPADRQTRCENWKRRAVVISDTDSCFLNLGPYMSWASKMYDMTEATPEEKTSTAGVLLYLLSRALRLHYDLLTARTGVPEAHRSTISAKNEFYYPRIMLTPSKKQYAGIISSVEGKALDRPRLDVKGLAIKKSSANRRTREYFYGIIEGILRSDGPPDRLAVLEAFASYEEDVRRSLQSGSSEYASPAKYGGASSYAFPERMPVVRGVDAWNACFPADRIQPGDKVGLLKATGEDPSCLEAIRSGNAQMADALEKVFWGSPENPSLYAKYGVSVLAVPLGHPVPPEWLPLVDVDAVAADNVRVAVPVLESLGLAAVEVLGETSYATVVTF